MKIQRIFTYRGKQKRNCISLLSDSFNNAQQNSMVGHIVLDLRLNLHTLYMWQCCSKKKRPAL
ncbi:hypothetical protein J6590_031761 [Homalodisca vitripennis]|nr:hypothetical protein J6590_031761 [Homalodisca vitripennis]